MPGNHGEISLTEQSRVDNDNKKATTRNKNKNKKKKDVIIADDDDDDDDDDTDDFGSANRLVTSSISKTRKRFIARILKKKPKSPKRCSSSSSSRFGSRKGGCFCVMRPRRIEEDESCTSSPTSDPNDESFTHEMLRVMLETNDFWSNDCNPHR